MVVKFCDVWDHGMTVCFGTTIFLEFSFNVQFAIIESISILFHYPGPLMISFKKLPYNNDINRLLNAKVTLIYIGILFVFD